MSNNSFNFNSIRLDIKDNPNPGFYLRTHGRGGFIYFVEADYVVPIAIEMPAVKEFDLLIFGETEHIKEKYYLMTNETMVIDTKDRFRIQELLVKWLKLKGLNHDIKIGI